MNILGTNQPLIAIGDADGLIAVLSSEDANHEKAISTVEQLLQHDAQTVFPLTTIAEAVTTLYNENAVDVNTSKTVYGKKAFVKFESIEKTRDLATKIGML
jgi:large subunit ribosomal protein L23